MQNKVAIVLVNYNMPERADQLMSYIHNNIAWPYDTFVVDNGSDLVPASHWTTISLDENVQTCNGWLAGLRRAKEISVQRGGNIYLAYWILITSAEFVLESGDVLSPMCEFLLKNPDAVAIHPALTEDSTTTWSHMLSVGGNEPRRTFMIDNIAALYRADWFDEIGWFDPELTFAWGTDLETCWKARKNGKSIWIDERTKVKKVTNIGYAMDRMNMSAETRFEQAADEAQRVLSKKYGYDFLNRLRYEYTEDEWLGAYPKRL